MTKGIIIIIALALAGAIHLIISPEHYGHAPAHGIFFAISGLAQVFWAVAAWFRMNRAVYYAGLALSGGMLILWLLTQVATPPFAEMAEPVDVWMITSKLAELVGFLALMLYGTSWLKTTPESNLNRKLIEGGVVACIAGVLFYGGGYAAEPMLPALQHAADASHDNADGHHDGETDTHMEAEDAHSQDESTHTVADDAHGNADTHTEDEAVHNEDDGAHMADDAHDNADTHIEDEATHNEGGGGAHTADDNAHDDADGHHDD